MNYQVLRQELTTFYQEKLEDMAVQFNVQCRERLEEACSDEMTAYEMKALQYRTIADMCQPVLFRNLPFYYELGTMGALCDGAGNIVRYHFNPHAGGWTASHNSYLYEEADPAALARRRSHGWENLYLICGTYSDEHQHFYFNMRPVYESGLKGMYDRAVEALKTAETEEQRQFLSSAVEGVLSLKEISEKFAVRAKELLEKDPENDNYRLIAESAAYTPWNPPRTFYEALNACAFLRTVLGALEGIGYNTFGRLDLDLDPFYQRDLQENRLTKEAAYDLICKFLLTWDCHYDQNMEMAGYADHELENTYTLGGCDRDGKTVCNDLTFMFLRAAREEKCIYPKIKCRYSANSPKEYLDEINCSVIGGTSVILYQNDDACIPAMVRNGRTLQEARDYVVTGCWGMLCYGPEKPDQACYTNLLKVFEYSVHNRTDKMEVVGIRFQPFDDAKSFEEVYRITCENFRTLFRERIRTGEHRKLWHLVSPVPLTSLSLEGCIEKKRDYTNLGTKYNDDQYMCIGFPNVVDSLLVIKELCFDQKKYSLQELLTAVRNNWEGFDVMRADALKCSGWGDGSEVSCTLGARLNHDLYTMLDQMNTVWGGKIMLGHLTYSEIRFWAEKTLATPDGRRDGEYFAQGLTPSRLHKIDSVTSVIRSMRSLDASEMAGNTVVNIILPSNHMSLEVCEGFLRAVAGSAVQSLQLNCVTKEELLDAQIHPENHQDLIVRVCGFSAKFTSLSTAWQKEFLSRNFYE